MANYLAPPGHRMAYDRDGSVGFYLNPNGLTQLTVGQLQAINDESLAGSFTTSTANGAHYLGFIFPQMRDLVGYFVSNHDNSGRGALGGMGPVQTSPDTTTGSDGTWTQRAAAFVQVDSAVTPQYRTSIQPLAVPGIKAIRFQVPTDSYDTMSTYALHLYGDIAAGSEGDILQVWSPTTDVRLSGSALDFGDVPRSNVSQKQFRLKNRSATKTANNVVVGLEALTDATPSLGSQHQFSLDGSTWASTVTVTSIAPGAISPIVYVRRSTNAAAALSVWAARVTAVAGSWT